MKTNKALAWLLSIGLVVSGFTFPTSVLAADAENESFMTYYNDESGMYCQVSDKSDDEMQLAANLIPLAQPTGLMWHYDDDTNQNLIGAMAWKAVNNCEGQYEITLYRNGNRVRSTSWYDLYDRDGDGIVGCEFIHDDAFTESGSYTFEVIAKGDGTTFGDSVAAISPVFNFTAPVAKLATPSNVRWSGDGIIEFDGVANASAYEYTLYDQYGGFIGSTWDWVSHNVDERTHISDDLSWYLRHIASDNGDVTGIAVSVKAITSNISVYKNSDESAKSGLYDISSLGVSVNQTLSNIVSDVYAGNISATNALDSFLAEMNENDISNTDFSLSMIENPEVVENIRQLEEAFKQERGIDSTVSDCASDSGYLESRGIDVNKVEVVGAALNSQGSDVDINFSEADPNLSVDQLFYKNSVAVNIGIDGVRNSGNLDVPIQITMPVPRGVIPDRLVILHYHADGSIEQIHPGISVSEDGDYLVTFVLTSFSPFVFCNLADENDGGDDMIEEGSINVTPLTDAPAGDKVELDIDIVNNPGIAALRFGISYDPSVFEFDSIAYGDVFDASDFEEGAPSHNPYYILAYVTDEDVTSTGKLATLTFNVKPDAEIGYYGISIVSFEACDIYENDVIFDITDAIVSVVEPIVPTVKVTPVISSNGNAYFYVDVVNNPGFAAYDFVLNYNDNKMFLVEMTPSDELVSTLTIVTPPGNSSPYPCVAYGLREFTSESGLLYTFKFEVAENVDLDDLVVSVSNMVFTNLDGEDIEFISKNSAPLVFGDVNGDGVVNRQDLLRLTKYIAGYDVEISAHACDVFVDGNVNSADLLLLAKYVSGWNVVLGE